MWDPGDKVKRLDFSQAKWDKFEEDTAVGLGDVNSSESREKYNSLIAMMLSV